MARYKSSARGIAFQCSGLDKYRARRTLGSTRSETADSRLTGLSFYASCATTLPPACRRCASLVTDAENAYPASLRTRTTTRRASSRKLQPTDPTYSPFSFFPVLSFFFPRLSSPSHKHVCSVDSPADSQPKGIGKHEAERRSVRRAPRFASRRSFPRRTCLQLDPRLAVLGFADFSRLVQR